MKRPDHCAKCEKRSPAGMSCTVFQKWMDPCLYVAQVKRQAAVKLRLSLNRIISTEPGGRE